MSEDVTVQGLIAVPQREVALLLEAGHLFLEMAKHQEAEEVFAGVAALVPHSEIPLVCLGNLALSQGQHERALRFQVEATERQPDSALALAHRGEARAWLKRFDEARTDLKRAIELSDDEAVSEFASGVLDMIAAEVL